MRIKMLPSLKDLDIPEDIKNKIVIAEKQRIEYLKAKWQSAKRHKEINYFLGRMKEAESFAGLNHR